MAQLIKYPSAMRETQEMWVQWMGWEALLEEGIETHSSILPGEIHGLRSLAVYSPKGHKELDTTEWPRMQTQHTTAYRPEIALFLN